MRKTLLASMLSFAFILGISSCAATGVAYNSKAGSGSIFTDVKQPVTATGEEGDKVGRSCTHNVLGIAAFGDASIAAAKKNGEISTVVSVDEELLNVLFVIYSEYCTIVTGY